MITLNQAIDVARQSWQNRPLHISGPFRINWIQKSQLNWNMKSPSPEKPKFYGSR